jgi:anthranilate synthase/aminodeoxychorismate synthase-like glutamine amidotransferase
MKKEKILLLDNNDSFTYNIVDYLRRIENIDFSVVRSNNISANRSKFFDKIIISPGPGLPKDYPTILDVLEKNYTSKPILGICLGCQAIGKFFGGTLVNIIPVIHGQACEITVVKNSSIFKGLPTSFKVGLYHSWAIDYNDFPDELEINAVLENRIIMSITKKSYSVYGVQFHPESFITEYGFQILKNFVDLR